ncbi:MAG TPA: cation:proton antiporter, partial [Gaiellaceae bacterium]
REFFLLFTVAFVVGMAALAEELGLSEAIGALMAGVVLAGTTAREEIEERFFSFRDLFGALFFFVFGLSIDVGALDRVWWLLVLAVALTLVGMAAVAQELGLSEAIGALMAGIVLAETSVREEIEERFFSFRDVFAALFFFVFGLSIDVGAIGEVGWLLAAAVVVSLIGKVGAGNLAGRLGGLSPRQSFNAGVALVAHGEFTIVLAQLASTNESLPGDDRAKLVAFAGLYVLVSATLGLALMRESKALGRRLFRSTPTLAEES